MTTDKIQFTKEKETLLVTLNGRAVQRAWVLVAGWHALKVPGQKS